VKLLSLPKTAVETAKCGCGARAASTAVRTKVLGGAMTCKDCASENQQHFPGELTLAFPSIESLKLSNGYVSPEILVCLECGYTQLVIPELELRQLRKGMKAYRSKGAG
jgi:hypothetical protein